MCACALPRLCVQEGVAALRQGANDYVTLPMLDPAELEARISMQVGHGWVEGRGRGCPGRGEKERRRRKGCDRPSTPTLLLDFAFPPHQARKFAEVHSFSGGEGCSRWSLIGWRFVGAASSSLVSWSGSVQALSKHWPFQPLAKTILAGNDKALGWSRHMLVSSSVDGVNA
eukprot:1146041-Pelagomonas_calceolata.AAC.29